MISDIIEMFENGTDVLIICRTVRQSMATARRVWPENAAVREALHAAWLRAMLHYN